MQESVRRDMANYLHGHVQSKLIALSMSLGMCRRMLTSDPGQATILLGQVQVELQKVQDEDLRRVSHELYPAIIKIGLVPAMRSLIDRFNESLETSLIIDADVFGLDQARDADLPEKEWLGVYRIAEEALNNALKHAHATHIEVNLIRDKTGNLVLSVKDDGCGFDPGVTTESPGLAMMADYASAIGGQATISSSPEKGTTVSLAIRVDSPKQFG
jgi:signal transduction histidine kinase